MLMTLLLIFLLTTAFRLNLKQIHYLENNGTKDVKIMTPLKYLSNLWRTFEMPLVNSEINLISTWSANCFIIDNPINNQVPKFQ